MMLDLLFCKDGSISVEKVVGIGGTQEFGPSEFLLSNALNDFGFLRRKLSRRLDPFC